MEYEPRWLNNLDTPALVVDVSTLKENIQEYQKAVNACGVSLRAHTKTHKIPRIAKMQIDAGACGILTAKISEAEVMADGGIDNIFICYPIIGKQKLRRLSALNQRVNMLWKR